MVIPIQSFCPRNPSQQSLEEAVACAQEAGRKYITVASRVLNGK